MILCGGGGVKLPTHLPDTLRGGGVHRAVFEKKIHPSVYPHGPSAIGTASDPVVRAVAMLLNDAGPIPTVSISITRLGVVNLMEKLFSSCTNKGGVFAQRAHSANEYGDYPGNNPENHPPAESCTINSKLKKFKHLMLAMGPRDLNSAPYSPVHCSSHSMTSFQSSELTELPVVENSQLFAQRRVRPKACHKQKNAQRNSTKTTAQQPTHPPTPSTQNTDTPPPGDTCTCPNIGGKPDKPTKPTHILSPPPLHGINRLLSNPLVGVWSCFFTLTGETDIDHDVPSPRPPLSIPPLRVGGGGRGGVTV